MMLRKKSSPWMRTKALYIIPVAVIALSAFATPELNNKVDNLVKPTQVVDNLNPTEVSAGKVTQKSANNEIVSEEIADTSRQKPIVVVKVAKEDSKNDATDTTSVVPNTDFNTNEIYDKVDEIPQYPGGMPELMNFLAMNVKYPKIAQDAQVAGRVLVQFVVEKDGSVSNVKTIYFVKKEVKASSEDKDASTGEINVVGYEKDATANDIEAAENALKAEAERIVKKMPNWTPGKQKGEAVRVKFTLPITFSLK